MENEQVVNIVGQCEFGLELDQPPLTLTTVVESNTPEISEEDLQDVARSLMSSFASLLPMKTFECRDAETSTVSNETKNVETAMSQPQEEQLSPSRRSVLPPIRAELKDAQTETETEITKHISISTVEFQEPEALRLQLEPNVISENQENIPPLTRSRTIAPLTLTTGDNPAADFFFDKELLSLEEVDLIRQSRKHASSDRLVPSSKKYMKIENIYQTKNVPMASSATGEARRRQSNFRYYDYDCIEGFEERFETQCQDKTEAENENTAVVPDVDPTPCPQLRLGLSRRSRPRKPLHENVFMDQ